MVVELYNFAKRLNSTKQPDTAPKNVNGALRDNCSVLAPQIGFAGFGNKSPNTYNYAYIPDFGRMYYIDNWTYSSGLWYANMTVDALATWRAYIGDSTEYVVRSSAERNPLLVDSLYPTLAKVTHAVSTTSNPFAPNDDWSNGDYCLATIAKGEYGVGVLKYWRIDATNMAKLANALLSNVDYLNLDAGEISDGLAKALFDPAQYLTSLIYYPFELNHPGGGVKSLPVGWWDMDGIEAQSLYGRYAKKDIYISLDIPKHPQQTALGDWVNLEPYTRYTLNVPPFGDIALDSTQLIDRDTLYLHYQIDQYTGNAQLRICTDAGYIYAIRTATAQIGVPMSLAQISVNPLQAFSAGTAAVNVASGVLGAVGGIKDMLTDGAEWDTSAGVAANLKTVASGVGDAIQAAHANVECKGAQGCMAWRQNPPRLYVTCMRVAETDNSRRGSPLCKKRRIRDIPGYVQVYNPDFSAPATSQELANVTNMMQNGFYYE